MKKRKVQTYGKCANFIAAIFNYNIDCGKLLDVLKYADDKPVHKKNGENCLLAMMETFKELADKGNNLKARLTDFSKAFECIDQDLLIAKLCCYT